MSDEQPPDTAIEPAGHFTASLFVILAVGAASWVQSMVHLPSALALVLMAASAIITCWGLFANGRTLYRSWAKDEPVAGKTWRNNFGALVLAGCALALANDLR